MCMRLSDSAVSVVLSARYRLVFRHITNPIYMELPTD